MSSTTLENTYQ